MLLFFSSIFQSLSITSVERNYKIEIFKKEINSLNLKKNQPERELKTIKTEDVMKLKLLEITKLLVRITEFQELIKNLITQQHSLYKKFLLRTSYKAGEFEKKNCEKFFFFFKMNFF